MPPKSKATIIAAAAAETPVIQLIPAEKFSRYPTNRIPSDASVKSMTESVREHGIIQAILARPLLDSVNGDPVPDDATPSLEIIFGETRWRACLAIDPSYPVPCRVVEMDDRQAAKIHAIENFQRLDLTPIEEAKEVRHLMDVGWNLDEVMTHIGRAKDWCYMRLGLLQLSEDGQQAVNDGSLSVRVASKIAQLPEEKRDDAIKACVTPTHSSSPLTERDALHVIQKQFLEPLKAENDWNAKKRLLTKENPGATFLDYDSAKAASSYDSEFEPVSGRPHYHLLCEAAQDDEMAIPTWGELAEKHKAPLFIGFDYSGDVVLYVKPEPLIEAEKAAFKNNPGDCVFRHEDAIANDRKEAERSRMTREREEEERVKRREALEAETRQIVSMILNPSGKGKTITRQRNLAVAAFECMLEYGNISMSEMLELEREEDESDDDFEERGLAAVKKLICAKDANPFEVFGRIYLASEVFENPSVLVRFLGDADMIDKVRLPLLHAEKVEHDQRLAEFNNRRADQIANGEADDQEDAA